MKKSLLFFAIFLNSMVAFAQLEMVYYEIDYNESTDLFDCKMYVESGTAISAADRLQLPARLSIIAATGTTVSVAESVFPIYNNESYTGTVPMEWMIDNVAVDPAEFPGYDVIRIVPDLSQPAHYNDITFSGYITLFSLSASGPDVCNLSLSILDNYVDPTSIGGIDFSNSMMIGTTNELYEDNLQPGNVESDLDIEIIGGSICAGDCITLTATFNCVFPGLVYEWSYNDETTQSITVCPEVSQQYVLSLSAPFEYSEQIVTYVDVDNGIEAEYGTNLCVGVTTYFYPEYGIWTSSDESVVIINNDGVATPLAPGIATLSHTNELGNCLDEVVVTVVSPESPVFIGSNELCLGETTQLLPSSGVIWTSNNPEIATINNSGLVTATGFGTTFFSFITLEGQCQSEPSGTLTVLHIPETKITGADSICVNGTTTLTPNAGVTWVSSDPAVATITNDGVVTGVSEGLTRFSFTDMATGCTSEESESVTVLPSPVVELSADTVCQYTLVDAISNMEGGIWQVTVISGGPFIAEIDDLGTIETDNPGIVSVQYISAKGCASDDSVLLTILPKPTTDVTSNSPICIGETLTLSASSPLGSNYSYEWFSPDNDIISNQMDVVIPNASQDMSGVYTLIASENGCMSDEISIDVYVEDCNPCDDEISPEGWIKLAVSDNNFIPVGDYEVGSSLVTGRELEDLVYYNPDQFDVRLVKNTGSEFFEEEIVLFDLPSYGPNVRIDIVDIDQDGLNDIITYQSKASSSTSNLDTLLFTIFNNKDNYAFQPTLSVKGESGLGFTRHPVIYKDLDGQGFLDIIPSWGSIYFTEGWQEDSYEQPQNSLALLVDDINEDGFLDVLRNGAQLFINNGDRTFDLTMIEGATITDPGLYYAETGYLINGLSTYQITTGDNPFVELCNDPFYQEGTNDFFTANITSNNAENIVGASFFDGFYTFQSPMTCENSNEYELNPDFVPTRDGRIDLTGNGFTDFLTVENGTIFVWINPTDQPVIRGTAFIDNNGDGQFNENDSPLRNVLISISPGQLSVLTDENGEYQLALPEGTYTLTAKVNEGEWIMDEIAIENFEITEPCNLGFDFGFVPDPTPEPMVNLSMVNTIARCDFETRFTITVENVGTEPLLSLLQFEFDNKTTLFDVEFSGSTTIGNKVLANIGPLAPFQPQKYKIVVKMPGGTALLPMLDFKASLLDNTGEIIAEYGYTEQLRCSYDPNDKRVFPDREGDENLTLMDESLEYTIRFQNNGNDTAYNVKIIDPLESHIEPSSIRVVSSSHDVETCIEGTDLIFLFEDIYLVDSMTNYPSSQGYVTFRCNSKDGLAEFTEVNNTADIFFDTNLPITTNQTLNTLVSELCTDKSTVIDKNICDGEDYLGYSESGIYTESFDLPYGCDSLVTINLMVQGITYSQQTFDVCNGLSINLGEEEYFITEDVTIIDTVYSDLGCITDILKFKITAVDLDFEIDKIEVCLHDSGSIWTGADGTWIVEDESILVVDNGILSALSTGSTTIEYLDNVTGCVEDVSVEVFGLPEISNEGFDQICINETSQFIADVDGTWISSNPEVASISEDGLIVGLDAGSVSISFVNEITGCGVSKDIEILPLTDSNCLVSTGDLTARSIQLYPNPARESIIIESKEVWNTIRLLNSQGQLLSQDLEGYVEKKRIDLNEVSSGLYFMMVEMESGVVIKKFVVD